MMILISSCLAGVNCNYRGGSSENSNVVELIAEGKAIMVCPEQLGGLTTPRPPAEIRGGRVFTKSGEDLTEAFVRGAKETLRIAEKFGCKKAILKSHSPSCGSGQIRNGEFNGALITGDGITAALLKEHGIEVSSL